VYVSESQTRRQYVEHVTTALLNKIRDANLASQRDLLSTVVPPFVNNALLTWLDQGMDPKASPVTRYDHTALLFFSFNLPDNGGRGADERYALHQLVDAAIATEAAQVVKIKTVGNLVICAGPLGLREAAAKAHPAVSVVVGMDTLASSKATSTAASSVRASDIGNEKAVHYTEGGDPAEQRRAAALAMARVARRLGRMCDDACVTWRAGLHCGEVVAAVLGTLRLSFDIFGDAMNTASRIMTHAAPGTIECSVAFVELLHTSVVVEGPTANTATLGHDMPEVLPGQPTATATAGAETTICAVGVKTEQKVKGKGIVTVQRLLDVPM